MVEEFDRADTNAGYDDAVQEAAIRAMPGGPELIDWFGFIPWFHDDEIERLELSDKGTSRLVVRSNVYGDLTRTRASRVTLAISEIVEIQLEHFYRQNVIGALRFRLASHHDGPVYGRMPADSDVEILIESILGLSGTIRCAEVTISLEEIPIS